MRESERKVSTGTGNGNVKVGEKTYAYLKCIQQAGVLWSCVFDAIALSYGETQADKIIGEEYFPIASTIHDFVKEYMFVSITENIGSKDEIVEI